MTGDLVVSGYALVSFGNAVWIKGEDCADEADHAIGGRVQRRAATSLLVEPISLLKSVAQGCGVKAGVANTLFFAAARVCGAML